MKQKIGIFFVVVGIIGLSFNYVLQWITSPIYKANTPEQLVGTVWDPAGFLFIFNGQFTFFGLGLTIIGILFYSTRKGSYFWLWGFVPFIAFLLLTVWQPSQAFAPLFGIGGGIVTLSYFGVLWAWINTHTAYEGDAKTAKHIQLIGYSFLYMTALFLCIYIGTPKHQGLANIPIVSGQSIVIAFSVGFALLAIGQYLAGRHRQ